MSEQQLIMSCWWVATATVWVDCARHLLHFCQAIPYAWLGKLVRLRIQGTGTCGQKKWDFWESRLSSAGFKLLLLGSMALLVGISGAWLFITRKFLPQLSVTRYEVTCL